MTQQQTHKALYIVALFALLSLISIMLTLPYTWRWFYLFPGQLIGSIFGVIVLVLLIVAPLRRENRCLFSVIFIAIVTSYTPISIYHYFCTENFSIATVGIVPGIFSDIIFFLLDFFGLLFLCLRSYGYIKEHRAGLNTKF